MKAVDAATQTEGHGVSDERHVLFAAGPGTGSPRTAVVSPFRNETTAGTDSPQSSPSSRRSPPPPPPPFDGLEQYKPAWQPGFQRGGPKGKTLSGPRARGIPGDIAAEIARKASQKRELPKDTSSFNVQKVNPTQHDFRSLLRKVNTRLA
ncbi:MAG TPA: hypothetical protein VL424_15270 [Pararobbsia sp.]|nr:hypothetical protein [Pararobbsia sp.]